MTDDKELVLYDWRKHEALLVGMWYAAMKDGTMSTAFHPYSQYLTQFLSYFRDRATMGIGVDDKGIWFSMSAEPLFAAVSVGLWVRHDRRKTRAIYEMAVKAHDEIYKVTDNCIAMTCLPDTAKLLIRFGYKAVGNLAGVWNGNDVLIFQLSKDDYDRRRKQQ